MFGRYVSRLGEHDIDLMHPDPQTIDLDALDAKLAAIRRYGGEPEALTVMQHVNLVLLLIDKDRKDRIQGGVLKENVRRWAAHHDDHEAIIGDIINPVKQLVAQQSDALYNMERRIDLAICKARRIPTPTPEVMSWVHDYDILASTLEWRFVLGRPEEPWNSTLSQGLIEQADKMIFAAKTLPPRFAA